MGKHHGHAARERTRRRPALDPEAGRGEPGAHCPDADAETLLDLATLRLEAGRLAGCLQCAGDDAGAGRGDGR
jgi:hypothetical protein